MNRLLFLSLLFLGCIGKPRWHVVAPVADGTAALSVRVEEIYRVDGHALVRIVVTKRAPKAHVTLLAQIPQGATVGDLPEVVEPDATGQWTQTVEIDWRRGGLPQTDLLLVATLREPRSGTIARGAYHFGRVAQ